jgi:lysophospholipase L1-like esterase
MAWSNVGNLKGPKGDVGETSDGIPQGAIVLAYNASPTYRLLQASDEWIESGNFTIGINRPDYDSSGNPTPNDTGSGQRRLVLFAKAYTAYTETVDVFIGDSTTAIWGNAPADKNWTTLIANADGISPVNVAVSGAGFLNDAGIKQAYPDQVTTAIRKTQGKTVRRVFLVGLVNDKDHIQSDLDAEINAMTKTATMIKSAWPGAQLIYIVEVVPQTPSFQGMLKSFSSVINQTYTLFESNGFEVARDWSDWLPDGKANGYLYDSMHANAKGMNVAAHKIREWVNTLSGPRIDGEIPAWSE